MKEVKFVFKNFKIKMWGRKLKVDGLGDKYVFGKVKEGNVEEDDVDECMFLLFCYKKIKDVVYAEFDEDEFDYEVYFNSDSDREFILELEDFFDDIWKECVIMVC